MIDETLIIALAFIIGLAPAMAVIWIFIAKAGLELFSPADVHAIQDKADPVLIPGTNTVQSGQTK